MTEIDLPGRYSLSRQLIKRIFGLYFLLAIVVTAVQLVIEYRNEKRVVLETLQKLPVTFGPGIATSLWTYNDELLNSVLSGMYEIPMVAGIRIQDSSRREISAFGIIMNQEGEQVYADGKGRPQASVKVPMMFGGLFGFDFPIIYTDFNGTEHHIGTGTVYSREYLVMERIRFGLWLILINSLVKTAGLWILFIFFIDRILQQPIQRLIESVGKIDLNSLKDQSVDAGIPPSNELKFLESAFNKLLQKLSQQVGMLQSAHDDLENRVQERTTELRKLSQAVEQSPNAVIITNRHGVIEYVNPAFCEITGYSPDEAIGQTPALLDSDNRRPEDYDELWQTVLSGRRWTGEFRNRKKNGDRIWQLAAISALTDETGEITHLVGTQMVIDQIKEAEEANRQAREDAEAANRAKSEFLATMSHEIRTPMNAIMGFTELLIPLVSENKAKQYLAAIRSSGRNLLSIINDILDLSRIEAGKLTLRFEPVDPVNLLHSIQSEFQPLAAEKNLDFQVISADNVPLLVKLDSVRLRQILVNLVGNAIKFTEHGRIQLKIDADYPAPDTHRVDLRLAVSDTGIGIPEEARELIFESFRQQDSKTTRRFGGTGLGLSISRRLVTLMGGVITVESTVGHGSVFKIELKDISVLENATKPATDDTAGSKAPRFKPARILVADDVTLNRELIIAFFADQPFDFLEAGNGAQALEIARREKPDLVLLDIRMPVMDGRETLRRFREDDALRAIPVIALTASVIGRAREELIESGFNGFVAKPVVYDAIVAEISPWLQQKDPATD
jgi:PAS domain S-box-containing protein